jgi:hypothetical protein
MDPEKSARNYASHRWKSELQSTPSVYEWVCYCDDCGCENLGDPAEFPNLEYPNCTQDADDLEHPLGHTGSETLAGN